jgi:hypothetical protein
MNFAQILSTSLQKADRKDAASFTITFSLVHMYYQLRSQRVYPIPHIAEIIPVSLPVSAFLLPY